MNPLPAFTLAVIRLVATSAFLLLVRVSDSHACEWVAEVTNLQTSEVKYYKPTPGNDATIALNRIHSSVKATCSIQVLDWEPRPDQSEMQSVNCICRLSNEVGEYFTAAAKAFRAKGMPSDVINRADLYFHAPGGEMVLRLYLTCK